MMEMRNAVLASVEAAAPPVRLVSSADDPRFSRRASCADGDTQTTDAKASVVRMICVRK